MKLRSIIADDAGVAGMLTGVHRLALSSRLTSYDAAYLALALQLDLPLATRDNELICAARRRISIL
jgi:predicted nucleic acid-binding protein